MSPRLLKISPDLNLPEDTVTSTVLVYGGKGMGKTNCGAVLVEELSYSGLAPRPRIRGEPAPAPGR